MGRATTAKAFGVILREQRNAAGLSQEKLALEAGRDRRYISQLENGLKQPTLETLFRVSRVLKVVSTVMVERTQSLTDHAPPRPRRPQLRTVFTIELGEETCPGCKAVYTLQARRLVLREKGRFRCGFCKHQISTWAGTTSLVYTILHPPES